ncbi:unnamed protein product, partial [Alopecurus aequalis]
IGLQHWLVALLLCAFAGVAVPQPAVVPLSYNVGSGTYSTFVNSLRNTLAAHPNPDNVQGHPVLAKQRFGLPPARLLHVELTAGDKTATLALRDDNIYVIGFRAQTGNWFEFGYTGQKQPIIAGATLLECGDTYRDLVGGGTSKDVKNNNLRSLDLGRSVADAAVKTLAAYVHAGAPDQATRLALARLMIMLSEAARMDSISATVNSGWGRTSRLTDKQPIYMQNWGDLSASLLEWRQRGSSYRWPPKRWPAKPASRAPLTLSPSSICCSTA